MLLLFIFIEREYCTNTQKEVGKKGYKRRYIFDGWSNWTPFEIDFIDKVKLTFKERYGLDLNHEKNSYGPREHEGRVVEGKKDIIINGKDPLMTDSEILRFSVARHFVMKDIMPDLLYHIQWR